MCQLTQGGITMFDRSDLHRLAAAVTTAFALALFAPNLAFAAFFQNTIDPVASVSDNGRDLVVTGPISCTAGEWAFLHVTVTQRTTGALAEGATRVLCTGDVQEWAVHATTQGRETFHEAAATGLQPRAQECVAPPRMPISGWSRSLWPR